MIDMSTEIAGVKFKNPIITASGTFGFGEEFGEYADLSEYGGICVKGLTLKPRAGNRPPRIAETPSGILNSVGLQNPGVEYFAEHDVPKLKKLDTNIIANMSGNTTEEYCRMAEILSDTDISMIEMNISCPNVKCGGMSFGTDAKTVEALTKEVKKYAKKPLIVKLSPNVTSVKEIAAAAESGGADAVSLINTLLGMVIDVDTRKPVLANNTGGLSGPAVRPVAVRMVYEVRNTVKIPIIGMGGIMSGRDAVEFMIAGADITAIGTGMFIKPDLILSVKKEISEYMQKHNIKSCKEIVNTLSLN
ncbi:MAG: dihydroorotate dehydrogenase [Oscillospiraceae bacterium]|nr:dihydroorotate dehydrogenase [Oscillospiraceae bacterium]